MRKYEYSVSLGQNASDIVAENFGLQDDITKFWDENQPMEIADFLAPGQKVIVNPLNNAIGNYFKKRGTRVATMNIGQSDVVHPYFILKNNGCCWHLVDCSGFPSDMETIYTYEVFNDDETVLLGAYDTHTADYCWTDYYNFFLQNIVIKMTASNIFGTFTYKISTSVGLPPIAYQFNVYNSIVNIQLTTTSPSWIFIDWGDGTNDYINEEINHCYDGISDHPHTYDFSDGERHTITIYGCRNTVFWDNKH